jgi:hypothetical protein
VSCIRTTAPAAATPAATGRGRRRLGRQLRRSLDEHARSVDRRTVEPETLAIPHLVADDLLRLVDAVLVVVEEDARMILFFRHHQAPLAVEGDDDVAVVLIGWIDPFDREARQCAELDARHAVGDQAGLIRGLPFG